MRHARRPTDRPLPRLQRWSLDVAANGTVNGWDEPARRLVAVLRRIAAEVRDEYAPVTWRAPDVPDAWFDGEAVHRLVEQVRPSAVDATGDGAPEACGIVHGHLGNDDAPIVDVLWQAGTQRRALDCTVRFNPRGGARSLSRHDPAWLVGLLRLAVNAAGGDAGRIVSSCWLAEDDRRMRDGVPPTDMVPFWLGEVTYLPGTIDPAMLPASLVAHPSGTGTGTGTGTVVALADLSATVTAPARAVDDMLTLRPYLPGA